ncbi:hypothetical protein [Acinetobacter baumannii]
MTKITHVLELKSVEHPSMIKVHYTASAEGGPFIGVDFLGP